MPSAGAVRAGKAAYELFTDDSKLMKGLKSVEGKLKAWGSKMTAIGKSVAAAGTAVLAPLAASAATAANLGAEYSDMAKRTGASVESLSTLGYAAEQSGASLSDVEGALSGIRGKLVDAANGSDDAQKAFMRLGLSWQELSTQAPDVAFRRIAERLNAIPNPAMRAALATATIGNADLLPMISQLQALEERARSLGLEMSGEDASAAKEFSMSLTDLAKTAKMAAFQAGAALAPAAQKVVQAVTAVVVKASNWIRANRETIVTVAKIAAVVVAAGTAIAAVGAVLTGIAAIVAKVAAVLTFLASTPVLVTAALVAMGVYFLQTTGQMEGAIAALSDVFMELKEDALAAFEGISDALSAGDMALAMRILGQLLTMEWRKAVQFIKGYWVEFKDFFLAVWDEATTGLAKLFINAWSGIQSGWQETIDFLSDAWAVFTGMLEQTWNSTIGFISKAWTRLKGLVSSDIDVTAEVDKINKETAGKNQGVDDARDKAIFEREKKRQQELQAIERNRVGALEEIEQEKERQRAARTEANRQELEDAQRELDEARAAFKGSLDEAKAKKAATAKQRKTEEERRLPALQSMATNVSGTFNAAAARGFGGNRAIDAIKVATERTAAATERMARNPGGLLVS